MTCSNSEKSKRETKTRRRISRKIQSARYETVEISVEVEDTFEWSDLNDRQAKLDTHTKLVLADFTKSFNTVCKTLGLEERISVTVTTADGAEKEGSIKRESLQELSDVCGDKL